MYWRRGKWRSATAMVLIVAVAGSAPAAAAEGCLTGPVSPCATTAASQPHTTGSHPACCDEPAALSQPPACCCPSGGALVACLCGAQEQAPAVPVPSEREDSRGTLKWSSAVCPPAVETACGAALSSVAIGRNFLSCQLRPLQPLLCVWRI